MEQVLEDIQYLRTGDHLSLISQIKIPASVSGGIHGGRLSIACGNEASELIRVSLAADGFGTHLSHLENLSNHDVPGDIVSSTFLCENALSKKALQEQLLLGTAKDQTSSGSGYKTLLYGHAVCFKHVQSEKYLACMTTSPPADKLAFDIGLVESTVERSWWIIEPSNKQRSEGDKVKVGDEVILISVSSERYMYAALSIFCPMASFQPSCWSMGIVKRGDVDGKTMGFVKGGDTLRFQKGFDECLSVVPILQRGIRHSSPLTYDFGDGRWEGRSLFRIEFVRSKWNASCLQWGQPIRIRHVVSGRYLSAKENTLFLDLCEASAASCPDTLFALYSSKEDEEVNWDLYQEPTQGQPCVKYNEHPIFIKHVNSHSWLSYSVIDSKVPGKISGKRAVLLSDGHTDDSFFIRVSQYEETMASRFIMKALKYFNRFIVALKSLAPLSSEEELWEICSKELVTNLIKDLINYFAPPPDDIEHEEKQLFLKNLKLRQDLFQAEGFILVIREIIDCLKDYREHFAGEGADTEDGVQMTIEELLEWDEISSLLFELLASIIRGNHVNCSKFSEPSSLDWLMSRLNFAQSQDALEVLHCLLTSSPEAVSIFTENHIKVLIGIIEKFGKDPKVLEVMQTLCVSQDEAIRANQNSFLQHFTTQKNLTFQTKIVEQIVNVRPNVFIGMEPGSAMYYKWYFEVHVENILRYPHTHLRIGWATSAGFKPYPTRGQGFGGNGVGDDMYSWGFDGKHFWTDGSSYAVQGTRSLFQYDDVIGCCIDFSIPRISFTINGLPVRGAFEAFPVFDHGLFYPVASVSSLIQIRFVLGGKCGHFAYKPPEGYAAICELAQADPSVTDSNTCEMSHCMNMAAQCNSDPPGQHSVFLHGPTLLPVETAFHPQPVDLHKVTLTSSMLKLRLLMAESFHEQWSITKIEGGWIYGEQGIDENRRYHDCLKPFKNLNEDQQYVEIMTADEILKTIVALGYSVKLVDPKRPLPRRVNLPNNYALSNGYKPAPFDISVVQLGPVMNKLVDLLAENTHNIWAEAKIARNWTYGIVENPGMRRTPLLIEYQSLESIAKRGVRNSAVEAIKLIVVLGYRIEPPIIDLSENLLSKKPLEQPKYRTYRADYTRGIKEGKLYYEFEVISEGHMLVGWARKGILPSKLPSTDPNVFLFDGLKATKQNASVEKFGKRWKSGDVIGCFIDISEKSIGFSLNGEMMMDVSGRESAFDHFDIAQGVVPIFCIGRGEVAKVNFGHQPNTLKFYFTNGYHQGYTPLCFDMKRSLPLWASMSLKQFRNFDAIENCPFKSSRTTSADGNSVPAIKVAWDSLLADKNGNGHFIRLSLPLKVTGTFPLRPNFLNEPDNASGGGGRWYGLAPLPDGTIPEESEDPELNRPPIEFSKIRKHNQTTFLEQMQPSSGGKVTMSTPNKPPSTSDDESDDEPLAVLGFADQQLKSIASKKLKESSNLRPFSAYKSACPTPFYGGSRNKKFEDVFDFDKFGSSYQYSVRIYQGQETSSMFVGWCSSNFNGTDAKTDSSDAETLSHSVARTIVVKIFDNNGDAKVTHRRNFYAANVKSLCVQNSDSESCNPLTGIQIDTQLDVCTGVISFLVNKQPCAIQFQAEVGQYLFPCVFLKPTSKDAIQFEFTRSMTALPLSCAWFSSDLLTNFTSDCPPRLSVQTNDSASWLSLPEQCFQSSFINAADKGWRVFTDIPVKFCSLLLSEDNNSLDILELTERTEWETYHAKCLELYSALCAKGNHRAAHLLTEVIDEKQLLYLIQCDRLPGELRMQFFNLLIAMHFEYITNAVLSTSKELVFALTSDEVYSFPCLEPCEITTDLSRIDTSDNIQPAIEGVIATPDAPKNFNYAKLGPPKFNTDELKRLILNALEQGLPSEGPNFQQRDPPGGSHCYFLVPCLRLVDCLLLNNFLTVSEVQKLVNILEPCLLATKTGDGKEKSGSGVGLLQLELDEMVKVELIKLMNHLKDIELKQIICQLVKFSNIFVGESQFDQKRRYIEVMDSSEEQQASVLAKKTKEFRCNPFEQIKSIISFKHDAQPFAPCRDDLKDLMNGFHQTLLQLMGVTKCEDENKAPADESVSTFAKLIQALKCWGRREEVLEDVLPVFTGATFRERVIEVLVHWAKSTEMHDESLVENLFLLLFRQYDEINELVRGLETTYVITAESEADVRKLLTSLCVIRELINVSMGPDEEKTMIEAINDMTFNTIFYQHPELMSKLNAHESVMRVMVNIMSSSTGSNAEEEENAASGSFTSRRKSLISVSQPPEKSSNDWNSEMVTACCRFLSFFCRTSTQNQKAMFEKLDFLLENITMGLAYPSLQGSTPLDVAAASIHDNGELALALRQQQLESVVKCLCDCGLASNSILLQRGVPDIGWDPVVGERLLDFLKTTVWVTGESVQQNAFQIVRMLVRRPECLGPALRAGGKGLLEAVAEAIDLQHAHNAMMLVSAQQAEGKDGADYDPSTTSWDNQSAMNASSGGGDSASAKKEHLRNISMLNNIEKSPDDVQIGDAILGFYAALINLLGFAAPVETTEDVGLPPPTGEEADENEGSGGENQRVKAILQSLVPLDDLKGILSMHFNLPTFDLLKMNNAADLLHWVGALKPLHKAAIVTFWDRVYGIEDPEILIELVEFGFLPDLRTAIILDTTAFSTGDFAVALNRYLCRTVLPLMTKNAKLFGDAAESGSLIETVLLTAYRFYRCRALSNAQRKTVTQFLSAVIQHVRPQSILKFLDKMSQDLKTLEEHTAAAYDPLTEYFQCTRDYYCGEENIWGNATNEERQILLEMFESFFDALVRCDKPTLVKQALPCLQSLACAIPPDFCYSERELSASYRKKPSEDPDTGQYLPRAFSAETISFTKDLSEFMLKFAENCHDERCKELMANGWSYSMNYDEENKKSPNLKPFKLLHDHDHEEYKVEIRQKLRIIFSLGFHIEKPASESTLPKQQSGPPERSSKLAAANAAPQPSVANYKPNPLDMSTVSLSSELVDLANVVAECCHDIANNAAMNDPVKQNCSIDHMFVPYDLLTDNEKSKESKVSNDFIKFLKVCGFEVEKLKKEDPNATESDNPVAATQKRFALLLLEKAMISADRAAKAFKDSRSATLSQTPHGVSSMNFPDIVVMFSLMVIPLIEKFVDLHHFYYTGTRGSSKTSSYPDRTATNVSGSNVQVYASVREKELLLGLFCRLFAMFRERSGPLLEKSSNVECLKVVAESLEFSSIVRSSNSTVLGLVHIFFLSVVNELKALHQQMTSGGIDHVSSPESSFKGAKDLKFVVATLLPVLKLILARIGCNGMHGQSLIVGETQFTCYELLEQLYLLAADERVCRAKSTSNFGASYIRRQRAVIGDCLAEFAKAFPVAFLEPHLAAYNKQSILNNKDFKQRFEGVCTNVPTLEEILNEVNIMAESDTADECYDPLLVIEVLLPMAGTYLRTWVFKGPEYELLDAVNYPTGVIHDQMTHLLSNVLTLVVNNFGEASATWMSKIAELTRPIWKESTGSMLSSHFLPGLKFLAAKIREIVDEEARLRSEWQLGKDTTDLENNLQEWMAASMRDIYAFFPFLLTFMEQQRQTWSTDMPPEVYELFQLVTDIFSDWSKSQNIRREELNYVLSNEIDTLAYMSEDQGYKRRNQLNSSLSTKAQRKKKADKFQASMSLIMVACKRMIPIGMSYMNSLVQETIQVGKQKFLEKSVDEDVLTFMKTTMQKSCSTKGQEGFGDFTAENMLHIAKVLQRLHFVDHPPLEKKEVETHLLSKARRRAVMECFKVAPLYSMPRHKAINLFLRAYKDTWLEKEEQSKVVLIESLTTEESPNEETKIKDPLTQLVCFIKRAAQVQDEQATGPSEFLYTSYAEMMSNSCSCGDDDEEEDDGPEMSFEEQEMAKQKLLSEQSRLKDRGAAEMILLLITKCNGEQSEVAEVTLQLGISVLAGGNVDVQTRMLDYLLEKKDVSFFNSVAGFMQSCSVLNLDTFERCNKAEDQGAATIDGARVMTDASFTTKLFRYLQLLCEGHNAAWQDYLRVQEANTTSVNLINASVDYVVRLQESMSDFYWHYSSSDEIDSRGREAFMVAILVGKQVFASLTEMIQGPCTGNQLALTHSRLWDAVSGFFHLFASLQLKLSQDPDQMEFLRELMDLQKEMVTLLLSMLEGNVLNGPIGKQMVDTLALCSDNVEQVLQFFTTFLKYSEIVAGVSFKEYDMNGDGIIQPEEFRKVLMCQKVYTEEQMNFLLEVADKDSDGRISYKEFSERFSDPASEIGFNIALLFTNLSEHTTNDPRLDKLVEAAADLIDVFESQLGRIEILGGTKRIERVYFEISEENKSSWEAETIKESKREFLFSGVVGMADMEKLDTFVNFCEDTIYEMQHTRSLNPEPPDESLPTKEPMYSKLRSGLQVLSWKLLSPRSIMMLLLQLFLFFALKLPLLFVIKLPYWILSYTLRKSCHIVVSLIKLTLSPFYHLMKSKKPAAQVVNSLLKPRMSIAPPVSSPASPLPDLVIDESEAATAASRSPSKNMPNLVEEVVKDNSATTADTTPKEEPPRPATSTSSKSPAFLRLYESWIKMRESSVSFKYSSKSDSSDDDQSSAQQKVNQKTFAERFMCLLARNYYKIKNLGAILSFFINIILLFCRISIYLPSSENEVSGSCSKGDGVACDVMDASESVEGIEVVTMSEDVMFLEPVLIILAILHVNISFLILVAYYKLKVPLVVFQREKEVSRKLEFEGLYLTSQPEWNNFRAKWDGVVVSSRSFPVNFWDKFVKKRAKSKYTESVGEEEIDVILGMSAAANQDENTSANQSGSSSGIASLLLGDARYNIWKFGVIFSDQSFLYIFFYFLFSIAGNFSRFFFAIHLMDIAFGNKDLSAILRSVTHNGKQLVLTALLTAIVIYLYTVVAFNFFRTSYIEEAAGEAVEQVTNGLAKELSSAAEVVANHASAALAELEEPQKCANMWQCFIFHLHHGLRAGGGIGDEIEDPDGQDYMYSRIIFDMTFFFFVIVILLAIIQGLIIDAFGELRGQLEQTKEDLETKCFICGLGKEYFDEQAAHGFEIHTEKEHNFANYMFFLMYLINKDETEYTGQETYVWTLYQERNFDFFPLGDCFRKQYEEELKN